MGDLISREDMLEQFDKRVEHMIIRTEDDKRISIESFRKFIENRPTAVIQCKDYVVNGLADQLNEALSANADLMYENESKQQRINQLTEELRLAKIELSSLMKDLKLAFEYPDGLCSICNDYKNAVAGMCRGGSLEEDNLNCFEWRGV